MKAVVQEDRTGCAIASVAAITGQKYSAVKKAATMLGIAVDDPTLWSDPEPIRKLLAWCGVVAGRKEEPFRSWQELPARALLAIKWRRETRGTVWHWVVFARDNTGSVVLDSKRGLRTNQRTDFGRIKPKWFIRLGQKSA